jgi:3-oxoacyl-[acyl-carrier protein] reductase
MHTVRTVEATVPWIEKSDAGAILVISSVAGLEFDWTSPAYGTFSPAYGTFKAALIHYASRMASLLAPKHVRVNSVSPGHTYFEGGGWQEIEQKFGHPLLRGRPGPDVISPEQKGACRLTPAPKSLAYS